MANNIVEFNINGTSYTQRPYGTCSTAAGTAAKVVTCSGFNLVTGATVMVKFTNANTVANPTLNVNSKGAKAIYYRGAALTASSLANWGAGDVVEFRYNGTQWDLLNVGNTNTDTNTNYYPTAFAWTNGSTTGPTGSLTGSGMSAVSFGAIPSASASISGVVTTGAQTFAGAKTFNSGITVASPGATWQSNMTAGCINASYTSYGAIFNAPIKSGRVCISTYPGQTDLMYFGYYKSTSTENNLDKQMTWDAPNNTLTVDILKGKLDWSYIQNKPTIPTVPTVGNGTITITQNGTSKGSFTVNQTGNTSTFFTGFNCQTEPDLQGLKVSASFARAILVVTDYAVLLGISMKTQTWIGVFIKNHHGMMLLTSQKTKEAVCQYIRRKRAFIVEQPHIECISPFL